MKSTSFVLIVVLFLLSSCVQATPLPTTTPMPTPAPTPTPTPNPTPTTDPYLGLPTSITSGETGVYLGPGNLVFEVLETLPAGTQVTTIGTFGDFVKIYDLTSNTIGYVWKENLQEISPDLPVLSADDVPWIEEDFIAENCMGPFTSIDDQGIATIQDYTYGPGNYQMEGAPIDLVQETRLVIQMDTTNEKTAYISMADIPGRISGEWYLGYQKVTIFKNYGGWHGYSIEFRDGLSADAITIPLYDIGEDPFELVFLDAYGQLIEIRDLTNNLKYQFNIPTLNYEGATLKLPQGLFPKQTMNLSCISDGPTMTSFIKHTMLRASTGTWEEPRETLPGLRSLAEEHGIEIIAPMEGWRLGDTRYTRIFREQASMAYLHDMILTGNFWLGIDRYNFEFLDHLLEYLTSQGWKIMVHLAYGNGLSIFPEDLRNSNLTKDEYREILHDYVTTLACRYKDQVTLWQIAAESPSMRANIEVDFWGSRVGPEYVDLAFQWVRECDPDGILMLTETIDSPRDPTMTDRLERTLEMVTDMKSRGIPIDAVGMEGHLFLPWDSQVIPNKDDVLATMQQFGELGVDVYITEMDVSTISFEGTREEKWVFQASMYKLMMDACLESGVCKSFGVFGIDDAHSWLNCLDGISEYCPPDTPPEGLWFDDNYNPKPAYWAVVQSLQEH